MPSVEATLRQRLSAQPAAERWWVALSGGLDSTVLLQALVKLDLPQPVLALHINHGLSPNADTWQRHCTQLCAQLAVPFHSREVKVELAGRGLEDAAREARYRVFDEYLEFGDVLLMGHHADDQAETLLLRLLRGTGLRGLVGIAEERKLGQGHLLRPLLTLTRAELSDYAAAHHLHWVEDESNQDNHYDRNYLRQQVMPHLQARWPGFTRRWQQCAARLAESSGLLEDLAALDLAAAEPQKERLGWSVKRDAFQRLSEPRWHNLLRYWLRELSLAAPEQVHLVAVGEQLLGARDDAEAEVRWGDLTMCRYRDRLYVLPTAEIPAPEAKVYTLPTGWTGALTLSGSWELRLEFQSSAAGRACLRGDLPDLQVRWRSGGERCHPRGRAHSQTLKKLLQEVGLEPWLRDGLPLIYSGDSLAAVGDLWINEGFAVAEGEPGLVVYWHSTRVGRGPV